MQLLLECCRETRRRYVRVSILGDTSWGILSLELCLEEAPGATLQIPDIQKATSISEALEPETDDNAVQEHPK